MYLFSRQRQINPAHLRKAVPAALEIGGRVKQITGLDLSVWMSSMSAQVGVVSWSVLVDRLTDLETATDKLTAESSFGDLVEQNDGLFSGPLTDILAQIVPGAPEPAAETPTYTMVVTTTAANGQFAAAMAAGVELANEVTRVGGLPTTFLVGVTGLYGRVAWVAGAPDLAALEDFNSRIDTNEELGRLIDSHGTKFTPGGEVTFFHRIS